MRHLVFSRYRFSLFLLFLLSLGVTLPARASLPLAALQEDIPTLAPLVKQTMPGVVNIATSGTVRVRENPLLDDPIFRHFFREFERPQQQERRTQSIGSGVIVDADRGLILTNNHVIEHADEIYVLLEDKRRLEATLVGADKATDIAVLEVESDGLTEIPLGDSDAIEVGDFAVAIGNPFGLGHTVTSGIISQTGRAGLGIEGYEDFIQTDASINPGNSGGALIDLRGRLIGINTAILSRTGGNVGIGFAIPINMARSVMQQLLEHGEVQRGILGVHIQDLTPELAEALGTDTTEGALVSNVIPDSPAEAAGLKEGDVITGMDGKPVLDSNTLRNRVGLKRVGETITLTVARDGQILTLDAVIGEAESLTVSREEDIPKLEGATFSDILPDHPLHGEQKGVQVQDVERGSPAWRHGLRPGDIIIAVNKQAVTTVGELAEQARAAQNRLLLHIRRGNGALYIVIS